MADSSSQASSTTPLIASTSRAKRLPILQRFRYAVALYLVKYLISIGLSLLTIPGIRNKSIQPTFKKRYSCHPTLTHRIYVPKTYKAGRPTLPLYLHIHGGGFAWSNPVVDDNFCSNFSNNNNILVVSLDYLKSPSYRFPAAARALTELVNAVLEDDALPIDRSKVAIGGFSAGGNLACAVTQSQSLQGRIGGLVAFYPPTNFSSRTTDQNTTYPKGVSAALPQGQLTMFNWGYVKEGEDLKDPILSPTFALRQTLPSKIYIIGCELDLLCRESEIMAEKMASHGSEQKIGSELEWERNGVKWQKVLGEDHAFDQRIAFGAAKARMKKRGQEMHDSAAEWLFREVYTP